MNITNKFILAQSRISGAVCFALFATVFTVGVVYVYLSTTKQTLMTWDGHGSYVPVDVPKAD